MAREKAGIIKSGAPLITGAARGEAREVIRNIADKAGIQVKEFGRDFLGRRTSDRLFTYESRRWKLENLSPPLPVSYQLKNASVAIAVVEELVTQGHRITRDDVRAGIAGMKFPGRFERLKKSPDVLIDGAHTPEGMRLLKSAVRSLYPNVRPLMLLGLLRDKNYEKLVRIIAPLAKEIVCVKPQGDRALDPEQLAGLVKALGIPVETAPSIPQGFELLANRAASRDVILAAGSLYMIGPVRRACGIADA